MGTHQITFCEAPKNNYWLQSTIHIGLRPFFFRRSSVFYLLNKKSWMYSNSPLQINTIIIFPEMPLKYLIVFHELHKMIKNFRLLGAIASGRTFYWEALVFSLFNKSLVHVRLTPWGLIRYILWSSKKIIADFSLPFTSVSGHFFFGEVQFFICWIKSHECIRIPPSKLILS